MVDQSVWNALMDAARAARLQAHAPYSRFLVGAAVLDEHGRLHAGCNVENAAYPQGVCAEAGALSAMVLAGGRRRFLYRETWTGRVSRVTITPHIAADTRPETAVHVIVENLRRLRDGEAFLHRVDRQRGY